MNANERLEIATIRMRKTGIPIPPRVLRAALDESRGILRNRPGLHPMVITITGDMPQSAIKMFNDIPGNCILRVGGQPFRDNRV